MFVQAELRWSEAFRQDTAYGREEVTACLAEARGVAVEYNALIQEAYQLYPQIPIWEEIHRDDPVWNYLYAIGVDCPEIVRRKHVAEPYPIKTWQKEIAKARRQMARLRRLMAELQYA